MSSHGASVCYANPAFLLRRPISELITLQEKQRKVGLLIPSKERGHGKELHHTELFSKAEVVTYRAWRLPGKFEWPIPRPSFFRSARKVLRDYDILHLWAHFYPSTLLLLLLSIFYPRTKIILTMDTLPGYSFSMGKSMDLAFKLYTWTVGRLIYGIPDAITLYGEALIPHAKRSGINMRKVRVLPTGILEHTLPDKKKARRDMEKELNIEKGTRIILYAGLLNPRKRLDTLLAVAKSMEEENVLFLIAGDGPSRKELEREAHGMENVRFLGWRKDLLQLMRAADLFLFPSSGEGLPGVVMEAMLCETPVVTTRIPCTTDLILHQKEGLLYAIGDANGMAKGVKELLEKGGVATRLSKAAKQRITHEYSWKRVLTGYQELYNQKGKR